MKIHTIQFIVLLFLLTHFLIAQTAFPFQNTTLSDNERLNNLLSSMTIDEKVNALSTSLGIPRLGIRNTGHSEGLPMVRALFIEFPEDPGAWLVDDAYLFGSDMLVAPLMQNTTDRQVYLPGGKRIDYQTGITNNAGWNLIQTAAIPAIILARDGAVIPHVKMTQSTDKIDWSNIELIV